ncbi:MAG TPA: hypothetical protein DCS97_13590 [Planctomycetes bacterium]|nr:hypothetical protein [Planctomycetota bacterium]
MPRDDQVAMLDWMLEYQRYGHPKMNAEEAKAAQDGLVERVAKITALESIAERAAQADALLQSPVVAKGKQGAELSLLWCVAAIALADAEADLAQRYRRLETVAGSERLTALPAPEAKAGRTKGKLQDVLTAYQTILKRWPDALAAKDAEAGLARVKALLQ